LTALPAIWLGILPYHRLGVGAGRNEVSGCVTGRLAIPGLVVSVAGLGCNNFGRRLDLGATRAVVDAAIEAGITLLDTADIYGNGEARRNSWAGCSPAGGVPAP
jgi:Aldo/keto reductase family